jgi:uncharacterized protein (TIGR02145 family)
MKTNLDYTQSFLILLIFNILLISSCDNKNDDFLGKNNKNSINSVIDIDGNEYTTIEIGNQEWLGENLRTTRYRNGDIINTGLNNEEWFSTTTGAYAIYPHQEIDGLNSDAEVLEAYGALYNAYAVMDSRGICPDNWRVPNNDDWQELIDFIGNEEEIGRMLRSARTFPDAHPCWVSPFTAGTDDYGFGALPSGSRELYYSGLGEFCNFWSNCEVGSVQGIFDVPEEGTMSIAWTMAARYHNYFTSCPSPNYAGLSVRCVRDSPNN